ncbi:MAG: cytochrome oxidase Cu insertion factor (SCO1/SenC/PrrC family) [Pseudohongiellaceae bacterium]|jgi:cytochrome oxidase Cu insertion factor (SCO1/SenC/PrrC family)
MTRDKPVTDQIPTQNTKSGSGRKILIIMVAIPLVVILLSTALYFMADKKMLDLGGVNNGVLITPPIQLNELGLTKQNGEAFDFTTPEAKWSFVVVGGSVCNDVCERMLYISRQTHHSLERRMPRVRRLYFNQDSQLSNELQQSFAEEYKSTQVVHVDKQALAKILSGSNVETLAENRFYVVDSNGWLMMYYSAEDVQQTTLNDLGKSVIRDMKRLLK